MKTFTKLLLLSALLLATAAEAQYCMLPGRTSYSSLQPGIINFKLNTINRTSLNVEQALNLPPVVLTADSTTLARGKTYTVTIKHSRDSAFFPSARNNIRVWIDYNKDLDFIDAGETVVTADYQTYGTFTATFTVPANAPLGTTRLRATAKMSSDAGHSIPTPCDDPADPIDYHGEMEDYKITIIQFPESIEEIQNKLDVSVYPNPTSGLISISVNNTVNEPVTIDLYDIAGKLIANLHHQSIKPSAKHTFDLNSHVTSPGIYYLKVSSGDACSYQKLVKVN